MGFLEYIVSLVSSAVAAVMWPFYMALSQANVRYFYVYIICGLVLAWLNRSNMSLKAGFVDTLLDKQVWTSRSAINDYAIVVFNAFLFIVLIKNMGAQTQHVTQWIVDLFRSAGVTGQVNNGTAYLAGFALTVALFLVNDFVCFYLHYLAHRWPVFWEFHKVHHSAEVLNFLTADRAHPLETTVFVVIGGLAMATVNGLFFAFFGDSLTIATVMGANLFIFLENIIGGALRHSPFPLRFPKFFETWLISPAMHHIHHSQDQRHFDKNMGRALSIWDRWLGTHHFSEENMNLKFGLGAETKDYHSVYEIYVRPFRQFGKYIPQSLVTNKVAAGDAGAASIMSNVSANGAAKDKAAGDEVSFMTRFSSSPVYLMSSSALLILFLVWQAGILGPGSSLERAVLTPAQSQSQRAIEAAVAASNPVAKSIFLQDLTFAEINYLIKQGYQSVIIPTGGTEQNGLHMILGKHNYVVRYTTDKIARAAGKILAAPVLAYVPEGDIKRRRGHMAFPGTVSLPQKVFESVLEFTARSMKAHGFKVIYLLGDSGGNQDAQRRVARKLSKLWHREGVKVVQLDKYYGQNGQKEALLARGFASAAIGTHAGITDSSELMFVHAEGVRTKMLRSLPDFGDDYNQIGYTGQPARASKEIGAQMVDLKIKAAVAQITAVRQKLKD